EATSDVPAAEQSTADARGAVIEPAEQRQAQAGGALVASFDDRAPPSPEIEAFCERVREIIRSKRPVDEESLTQANPDEAAAEAGSQVNQNVQSGVDGAQQSYDGMQETPPAGAPAPSTPATPTPEAVPTEQADAAAAAPRPLPEENTDLAADEANADQQMDDAGMNSETAQLVDSGPIADARGARGELSETASAERAALLARQQEAITGARNDMAALQERAHEALANARQQEAAGSNTQQVSMVGSEEQVRASVGREADRLFTDAQTQVRDLLQPLAQNAQARWDAEIVVIKRTFRSDLDAVQRAIDERHRGVGGAILAAWDWATGLPAWVTRDYDRAETNFTNSVCDLIRDISRDVNTVIRDAEAIIENARHRIDDLFAQLPEGLRTWAAEQQTQFAERIAGLHTEVVTARTNIERGLTQRAGEAVDEVRREVASLRQAARGALGRLADAIAAFLEDPVRAIINGLLQLVGISPPAFWALIDRIGQVIDAIADDPVGFASNLVAALGRGFSQFFDNFGTHVLNGLVQWLFSGLGSVGVQIPSDFSLRSLVTFFLQLMGITWDRVRRLLARHIGEQNVALIERAWQIVSTLIERGPEGIFEMLREQLDPQNILSMVLEAAAQFLIERLVRTVATRILGMLNPAGAVLQAIELIYRVVSWVFNNAARIFSLVETVVNGAADLVAGNIGGMANAVEGALARIIPPVIDFLAGLLGFGDLPDRIAGVIRGFQGRVERILDRVIGWLAGQARRLLAALRGASPEQTTGGNADHEQMATEAVSTLEAVEVGENATYPNVRQAIEQAGPGIVERYNRRLASNIRMRITLEAAEGGERDDEVDFTVTIAPNTTTRPGRRGARKFPGPAVGTHSAMQSRASSETPPDGKARESHHVPAYTMLRAAKEEVDQLRSHLVNRNPWKNNPTAQAFAADLQARSTLINGRLPGRGLQLSAILIHQETHRTGANAVHSVDMDQLIEDEDDAIEEVSENTLLPQTSTGAFSSNPRLGAWRNFFARQDAWAENGGAMPPGFTPTQTAASAIEAGGHSASTNRQIQAAVGRMRTRASNVLHNALIDAYALGKGSVASALSSSTKDGTQAERSSALAALDGVKDTAWGDTFGPL
ncbi:MAG TPA: hypothetical protein PKA64_10160, partial [Myxococcota bacterium]|nr:hypothetical protein [Myxococcota bacterium]